MLKKNITFTDYNGKTRSDDYYFNISKAEIAEMEMNESQLAADGNITGGLEERFNTIRAGGSGKEILAAFKDILFMAYGVKDEDGLRFRKSAEQSRAFAETEAYTELFMELIGDENAAARFMSAVMPFRGGDTPDSDKPTGARPKSPAQREAESAMLVVDAAPSAQPEQNPQATPPVPTAEQIQAHLDSIRGPVQSDNGPVGTKNQ